jgi:uncharacterized protein YegJ (DUF2314 family)
MLDEKDNIILYCPEHAPKPHPYTGPMQDLVGKHVKIAFVGKRNTEVREHMWVNVSQVNNDTGYGHLANWPKFVDGIKFADKVKFDRSEIEDIHGLDYYDVKGGS